MYSRPTLIAALILLAPLGGCVAGIDHPSLAPRPIEALAPVTPPSSDATPLPEDPALAARVAAIVAEARISIARFEPQVEAARMAVAQAEGAVAGSEAWVAAEQAISRAEAARSTLAIRLADLDRLRLDRGGAPTPSLDAAIAELTAVDAAQQDELQKLGAMLSAP